MYVIDNNYCSACGLCIDICPVEAINIFGEYKIDQNICIGCGLCKEDCPCNAIKEYVQTA